MWVRVGCYILMDMGIVRDGQDCYLRGGIVAGRWGELFYS